METNVKAKCEGRVSVALASLSDLSQGHKLQCAQLEILRQMCLMTGTSGRIFIELKLEVSLMRGDNLWTDRPSQALRDIKDT